MKKHLTNDNATNTVLGICYYQAGILGWIDDTIHDRCIQSDNGWKIVWE